MVKSTSECSKLLETVLPSAKLPENLQILYQEEQPLVYELPVEVITKVNMPADVAMHTNFLHFDKSAGTSGGGTTSTTKSNVDSCWNTENMGGCMTLLGPAGALHGRQSVQVQVYRTSVEHFAVIYPQKKVSRPLGVLNLRNTTIERLGDEGFLVRQKGCDSPVVLTFLLENPKDIDYWILAFTARSSPLMHQSSLPIVEEEEI